MTTTHMRHVRTLDTEADRGVLITMPTGSRVRLVSVEDTLSGASRRLQVVHPDGVERFMIISSHAVLEVEDPRDDLI